MDGLIIFIDVLVGILALLLIWAFAQKGRRP